MSDEQELGKFTEDFLKIFSNQSVPAQCAALRILCYAEPRIRHTNAFRKFLASAEVSHYLIHEDDTKMKNVLLAYEECMKAEEKQDVQ